MKKLLPLILALLLLLSACTPEGPHTSPTPAVSPAAPTGGEVSPTGTAAPEIRWWEDVSLSGLPSVPASAVEVEAGSGKLYLLASLPEQSLALYGYGGDASGAPCGILLVGGDSFSHFEQVYLSATYPALPELWWDDFDGDGSEELAVNYLVSNSAAANVFELHIYEPEKDGSWTDHALLPGDYSAQLSQLVSYSYDPDHRIITASCPSDSVAFPLNDDEPEPDAASPLSFLDHTFYRRDGRQLTGVYGLSAVLTERDAPQHFGIITAAVLYDGQGFTLGDVALQAVMGV